MDSLQNVDLNLLHTLRAFVDAGGVAAAGRLLGRSQPAITARLKQLERDMGVPLFTRQGRRLTLTPVGRAVDRDARALLVEIKAIVDRARSGLVEPAGLLRVGALPTVGVHVLAPIVGDLCGRHPNLDVAIQYGLADDQLQDLISGRIDVVVSVGSAPDHPRLRVESLCAVLPVVVLPADIGEDALDLAALPFFGFGRVGDAFFDAVWDYAESEGLADRARLVVPHIQTLKSLVVSGGGFSILPRYTVVEPTLATHPIEGLGSSQVLWMAIRASAASIPAVAVVTEAIRHHFA